MPCASRRYDESVPLSGAQDVPNGKSNKSLARVHRYLLLSVQKRKLKATKIERCQGRPGGRIESAFLKANVKKCCATCMVLFSPYHNVPLCLSYFLLVCLSLSLIKSLFHSIVSPSLSGQMFILSHSRQGYQTNSTAGRVPLPVHQSITSHTHAWIHTRSHALAHARTKHPHKPHQRH